jgi:hypothetical protein
VGYGAAVVSRAVTVFCRAKQSFVDDKSKIERALTIEEEGLVADTRQFWQ